MTDILIVGGGAVGITIARSLSRALPPSAKITLLEKEPTLSEHTSGRNSGVLHAGFYYSSESMKAQFCRVGCQMWTEYCEERGLPIRKCGKLVVPKNEIEIEYMHDLYKQGLKNGVKLEMITAEEARKIDPMVKGYGKEFIWSPTTSVVNSKALVKQMAEDLSQNPNIEIKTGVSFISDKSILSHTGGLHSIALSSGDTLQAKYFINAAGQQSLSLAHAQGIGLDFDFFPLKGIYTISDQKLDHIYKTLVYPVPIRGAPFLGVHSTLTVDGYVKMGPTVAPAFSLENYSGLENLRWGEVANIMGNYTRMLFNGEQRKLIWAFITQEMPKMSIGKITRDVSQIHKMNRSDFTRFYRPGIRAQLVHKNTLKLHNDFILDFSNKGQLHVLNLVSPGFTCSLPFADHIAKEMQVQGLI
ncbi:hypothetical protein FGO68_gene4483 [Halteria grandinella]|uniref:L-2-hydroxyglutarate dehydrogenase, mitochondrial n=1 Tax=Halteria grandinella TaxID=5974 RepID=A0A8J8NQ28_HALGN|nr:hypothetical protein FGO68_gene4483 [Halteria grandinella]